MGQSLYAWEMFGPQTFFGFVGLYISHTIVFPWATTPRLYTWHLRRIYILKTNFSEKINNIIKDATVWQVSGNVWSASSAQNNDACAVECKTYRYIWQTVHHSLCLFYSRVILSDVYWCVKREFNFFFYMFQAQKLWYYMIPLTGCWLNEPTDTGKPVTATSCGDKR